MRYTKITTLEIQVEHDPLVLQAGELPPQIQAYMFFSEMQGFVKQNFFIVTHNRKVVKIKKWVVEPLHYSLLLLALLLHVMTVERNPSYLTKSS